MPNRPIITLTTDFGVTDFYVAAMKSVLLRYCPAAVLIDVTHDVPRHDLIGGSLVLERSIASFGPETVHLCVIDPGVGTSRKMLVATVNGATVICPDNGLITWTLRRHAMGSIAELTWRPERSSNTFHGRDVMAPVAAMIASGLPIETLTGAAIAPVTLDLDLCRSATGRVIHIDHFGNATTNIEAVNSIEMRISVAGQNLGNVCRTYGDVAPGEPLVIIGSSDLLEIAVREGSAVDTLNIKPGDEVTLHADITQ